MTKTRYVLETTFYYLFRHLTPILFKTCYASANRGFFRKCWKIFLKTFYRRFMPLFYGCSALKGHHDSTKWGSDLRPRRPWGNIEYAGANRRFETSWFIAENVIWYCIVVKILKGMTLIPRNYQGTCLINVSQVVTILWMLTKHHLFVNRVFISRKKNRSLNLLVTKLVRLFNFLKHDRPIHWCAALSLRLEWFDRDGNGEMRSVLPNDRFVICSSCIQFIYRIGGQHYLTFVSLSIRAWRRKQFLFIFSW